MIKCLYQGNTIEGEEGEKPNTKICDKIFAGELKYKRVNWRRRRWKTIITKFVIKCLHVIYQGNWNTKESIEGEEGEKP